jgi:hypothetical protein
VRCREFDVATAAAAALGDHELGAGLVEIGEQRIALLIVDLGAHRNLNPNVPARFAELVLAAAVFAALGANDPPEAKIEQSGESIVRDQEHAASAFIDEVHARQYVGLFVGATDLVLEQIGGRRTLRKC